MRHGSLFSGIGGFDLASEWIGWENVLHCEKDKFCQQILTHYWPNAISYEDITKTDFSIHRGTIDIITGGFPCQPFSTAGKRKGKDDDRYLWPEMLRAINEIRPTWVIGENVAGIGSMVQPDAEILKMESQTTLFEQDYNEETITESQQFVIETICSDLEQIGYSVQPIIIPACAVGAPHKRDRIWFIAYSHNSRTWNDSGTNGNGETENKKWKRKSFPKHREDGNDGITTNTSSHGLPFSSCGKIREVYSSPTAQKRGEFGGKFAKANGWQNFPTQSPVCNGDDGISCQLDGITFPKWRNESIKGGGNALVPQIPFEIFKAINNLKP